jgi:hypothetical protein
MGDKTDMHPVTVNLITESGGNTLGDVANPVVVNAQLQDAEGNPIDSLSGAINVHSADVHIIPVNRRFAQFPGTNTTTLSANTSSGDTSIDIQAGDYANYDVGDWLFLEDNNTQETEFMQITVKPGSPTLTLDRPLDNAYASATATVEEVVVNMATNGSLSSPISFKVQPPSDEIWHITRINLAAVTTNASASDDFLSITALTNGVVLRQDNNGVKKTWTNWKADSDIMTDQYDLDNVPTVPAAGAGQRGRWWLKRADVIIRLDGSTSDFVEFLVQDDLTGADLSEWYMKAQGHIEGE